MNLREILTSENFDFVTTFFKMRITDDNSIFCQCGSSDDPSIKIHADGTATTFTDGYNPKEYETANDAVLAVK